MRTFTKSALTALAVATVLNLGLVETKRKGQDKEFDIKQNALNSIMGADVNEYPYFVKVEIDWGAGVAGCGGAIYNENWIITAAHCLVHPETKVWVKVNQLTVIAGLTNFEDQPEESKYKVKRFSHPGFNSVGTGNDIAVLRLDRSLNMQKGKIEPMKIASKDFVPNYGGQGNFIGLGITELGDTSHDLIEARMPMHEATKCGRLMGQGPLQTTICVGGDDSGFTVGQGDSGGPFVCADSNNKPILCGVNSYKTCGVKENCAKPSLVTRVSSFYDWILSEIGDRQSSNVFNEEVFPVRVNPVPDYLVRVVGSKMGCTGTLVSPILVLTAATCFHDGDALTLIHIRTGTPLVLAGKVEIGAKESTSLSKKIKELTLKAVHSKDLILYQLAKPVSFTPLKLAPLGYRLTDRVAIEHSMNEKTVAVESRKFKLLEQSECERRFAVLDKAFKIDSTQVCMSEVYSPDTDCNRDVGAPLVCEGNKLCGVSSFHACKYSAIPKLFTTIGNENSQLDSQLRGYMKSVG